MKVMKKAVFLLVLALGIHTVSATEYHVSISGSDDNPGTTNQPLRTIGAAAELAMPGDTITVHAGVYREQVTPPRGGTAGRPITYRAAKGEKVVIKGSEEVKGWQHVKDDLWKVQLPYRFFGTYNPFTDKVWGDWYEGWIHTGEVYLDGKPLSEVESLNLILDDVPALKRNNPRPENALPENHTWFAVSDSGCTTVYARFGGVDPNTQLVEVNVRKACFYPDKNFVNYITVTGFEMCHAATQWAPPTAEQPGLIGTNWSKGWIIEHNIIHDAKCTGITLGKDRHTGDNMWSKDPPIDGSVHYNEVVHRVIAYGWNKDTIGSHIVRNNVIYNCGQAGICGSFGAAFSEISGNEIYDIYTYRPYIGAEIAGIKLHAGIDAVIRDNYLHNATLGVWLDWMSQGTRVTGNLFQGNTNVDIFMEVNHGPYIIDNNILLSTHAIQDWSQGGAYAHNLIGGTVAFLEQDRKTPFFAPHSTQWLGVADIPGGDDRYYNNVFTGSEATAQWAHTLYLPEGVPQLYGLGVYNKPSLHVIADGNVYLNGEAADVGKFETNTTLDDRRPPVLTSHPDGTVALEWAPPRVTGKLVTSTQLGSARVPQARFEDPDGSELVIDTDYFGNSRVSAPTAGPFENTTSRVTTVWPKK